MRVLALLPCQLFPAYNGQTHRLSHVVRSLARGHDVALACFVEGHQSQSFPASLTPLFRDVKLVPIAEPGDTPFARWRRRLSRDPLDVVRFRSKEMQDHIDGLLRGFDPEVILIGDPALTQYLPTNKRHVVVMDYVCEAILQMERMRDQVSGPERWMWEGRRRKYVRFLQTIEQNYDLVFLNSAEDRDSLSRFWSEHRLIHVPNGLELDEYPMDLAQPQPGRMIYPGSVLYPPNRDAVTWFAEQILPKVRAAVPGAELRVTGAFDETAPQADGLVYTGRVEDIRREIASAWCTVVPLRLGAGGARFKVIESMALGSPIIGTAIGIEGLTLTDRHDYLAAEGADAFAQACIEMLNDRSLRDHVAAGGRARMEADYAWDRLFGRIEVLIRAKLENRAAA